MKLKQIVTQNPEVISPNAGLMEAAQKMKKSNVGSLPVCDGERLVGMITDRDIAVRGIAENRDPKKTKVREVMSDGVACCFEDQELSEAAELMEALQIRRLPVLNSNKHLIGIVSLGDVAVRSQNGNIAGEILECVSQPKASAAKQNAISRRAFSLYLEHGAKPGHDLDNWLEAEKECHRKEQLSVQGH
jgi:CBS domain-containing protein